MQQLISITQIYYYYVCRYLLDYNIIYDLLTSHQFNNLEIFKPTKVYLIFSKIGLYYLPLSFEKKNCLRLNNIKL